MDLDETPKIEKETTNGSNPLSILSGAVVPNSKTRNYRPYFTVEDVNSLGQKQRGGMSEDSQEKTRQLACSFIEAIGLRMGFPRKTIATSQLLYHRFRLFFPMKDFNYFDVSQATLYVAAKMQDTIKKPQDILEVGYTVRYPHLVSSMTGVADIDGERKAEDRRKLLAIERLVLETICFNFTIQMAFPYIIKFARDLQVSKDMTKLAWRLCADSHRTIIGLEYPPHSVALACIYLAGLLASFEVATASLSDELVQIKSVVEKLSEPGDWEARYLVKLDDLEDICHSVLDLLVSQASVVPQSYNTSPTTPSSPSPYPSPRTPNPFKSSGSASMQSNSEEAHVFTAPHLTRLKIALRKQEAELKSKGYLFRKRNSTKINRVPAGPTSRQDPTTSAPAGTDSGELVNGAIGKNEGTVRFLFGPEG